MEIFGWLLLFALITGASKTAIAGVLVASLVLGSLWFWVLVAAAIVALFTFIDHDDGIGATGTLIAFFLIQQLFGDFKVFSYVKFHPARTAELLIAYFLAGTLWAIAKWWFHVREERAKYDEKRASFLRGQELEPSDGIPEDLKAKWAEWAPKKPNVSDSKERILRWMSFWPWSMVWTLINDPIKKAFRAIYRYIQKLLQLIVDKAFEGTEADFSKRRR